MSPSPSEDAARLDTPATADAAPARRPRFGLLARVLTGIVLGIVLGLIAPDWLARTAATFAGLFSGFLGFIVPVLILALVAPAIAELGRGAGRWLGLTAAIAYASTVFGGFLGLAAGLAVFPHLLTPGSISPVTDPTAGQAEAFFTVEMAPPFGVMTALVLAFVMGIGMTLIPRGTLQHGFEELRSIVEKVISGVIVPLLPFYVFATFLTMAAAGGVAEVVLTFLGVIALVFVLTLVLLLVQFAVAGAVARRNPFTALRAMLPAYATALGTSSSAATIPVTLRQVGTLGVRRPVASFVVPLAATIHLAGSTVKIVSFSLAVLVLSGQAVDVPVMIGFIFMLGITMVAAPGVPGGAIVAASGLLASMLGFTEPQVALMVATYLAIDSFGTATNVTGDGAIALIVDRVAGDRITAATGGAGPTEPTGLTPAD